MSVVLGWVGEGEQVEISQRGKVIALLSPPSAQTPPSPRPRTDLAARLRMRDGDRVIDARVMNDILDHSRGAH